MPRSAGGAGLALIQTGSGREYRLTIEPGAIRVEASFAELPSPQFIATEDLQALLSPPTVDEIALKSELRNGFPEVDLRHH